MKHELLYQTQAQFNQAQGSSGKVTSITPGVAYIVENDGVGFNYDFVDLKVVYEVDDISNTTKIYNVSGVKTNLYEIIVDKRAVPASSVTDTYQFTRTGTHTIKFRYTSITSIPVSAFTSCTSIISINLPKTITTIGSYAFYNCTKLAGNLYLTSVTSMGYNVFNNSRITSFVNTAICTYNDTALWGTSYLTNVDVTVTGTGVRLIMNCGSSNNRCNAIIRGNWGTVPSGDAGFAGRITSLTITGNITQIISLYWGGTATILRIGGNCSVGNVWQAARTSLRFMEILGDCTSTSALVNVSNQNLIVHFGKTSKITANPNTIAMNNVGKIYVGDGSSQESDQAVLDEYLGDENWAAYTNKLDLWYNYSGPYKQ
jgi:hypothetical protein